MATNKHGGFFLKWRDHGISVMIKASLNAFACPYPSVSRSYNAMLARTYIEKTTRRC